VLSTPVLAAAPETPETGKANPASITATTATLEGGVLNPRATTSVEGGEYRYLYNPSPEECNDDLVSEPSGVVSGMPQQPAGPVKLIELEPNETYSFCLEELKGEEDAIGPRESFKTLVAPPAIAEGSESASATGYSVSLGATINADDEATTYFFEYSTSEAEVLASKGTKVNGESPLEGFGGQGSVNVPGLTQLTTYFYRVVAKNVTGKVKGKIESFTTLTPETPETLAASKIEATGTEATLNGVINPKHEGETVNPGTYEFVYRQSASECEREGTVEKAVPSPAGSAPATSPFPVSQELTGLLPGNTYTYCLLSRTSQGEALGAPQTFTTSTIAPVIESESEPFTSVTSSSATLHAKIDPGGAPTTYFFEYGPTAAYGSKTSLASAGAGSEPVIVFANLKELQPETTYYVRVVASNEKATDGVSGGEGSFSTFPVGLLGLPDGRAYELVSPVNDGDATALLGKPTRAAADGNAVAYLGTAPPTGGNGEVHLKTGVRPEGANVYLAQRSATGGWAAADIQPNADISLGNQALSSFVSFSGDLSIGIMSSEVALVEDAPNGEGHEGLYARDDESGSYQLLGESEKYAGATPNGSHVLVESAAGLEDSVGGGQLDAVSVLPEGRSAPSAVLGSPVDGLEHAVSTDGSRIFWTDTATGDLYVRESDTSPGAVTVQVDASTLPGTEREKAEKGGGGVFWTASSGGSRVFFTDENQLTATSTAEKGKPDLYEYELNSEEGKPGTLTDLTTDGVEPAGVVGVLGASEDGSYVYFAAAGALQSSGAVHQECPPGGSSAKCNLYVIHEGEAPKLVATVAADDGDNETAYGQVIYRGAQFALYGDWVANVGFRSAHVSAGGRELVFESFENLTGFDSHGGSEIYLYDYETGRTSCISCNPSGTSTDDEEHSQSGFGEYAHAELPESEEPTDALRDISADGDRVFFESNEALVSQDPDGEASGPLPEYANGLTNVYEWERDGSGSCARVKGCVYLLSGGTSTDISAFLDASENGEDVFIETRAQLTPQDHGETFAVYDAHECTAASPCVHETSTECTGTGCQGVPPAAPIFATPSSATITGVDDLEPSPPPPAKKVTKKTVRCAKGKKLEHGKCTKVKAKKKKSKAKKSVHTNRRAK
jgi:hypothetical protein